MGKARILQAHGEGRYTIEIIEARERAESTKQQAESRIQTLTSEANQLDAKIQAAQQAVDQAALEQNAAIEQWQQEVAEQGSSSVDLNAFARKLLEAAGKRDALRTEKRSKELRIAADQALVARINSLPPLRQIQAWCADYTDDLTGEVATAEVPGEVGGVIIKPGFEGANQWSATTDGAIQPALAGTPASVFYNLAMKPGWQKWRPTYRTATITSIGGDTCSIELDSATSSHQGLNVNAQTSYSGVPILYMDCDGEAFEKGDKVLVALAGNLDGPTVVGFESEPRVCCQPEVLGVAPATGNSWAVLEEFEGRFIAGGPSAEWRIIKEDGEVIYTGGVVRMPDGDYRLDGLPESVDTLSSEVVSEVLYYQFAGVNRQIMGYISFPSLPNFAGGSFSVSDVFVADDGRKSRFTWFGGVIGSDGHPTNISVGTTVAARYSEAGWNNTIQQGRDVVYYEPRQTLRLEKGCNGEWPVVGEK